MYKLHDLIKKIEKRPAIYLEMYSITALQHFINGYSYNGNSVNQSDFNNFCNLYFCNSSSISWSRMILDYNHGNEEQALEQFFELYEMFFVETNTIDSRHILHKLLYLALIEIRYQSTTKNDTTIEELSNFVHNLPLKLHNGNYTKIMPYYDEVLEEIIDNCKNNDYLKSIVMNNFPELKNCYWQVWKSENNVTLISRTQKYQPLEQEMLVKEFFSIRFSSAMRMKDEFLESQS